MIPAIIGSICADQYDSSDSWKWGGGDAPQAKVGIQLFQ
jgi:hypothetical protein